MQIHFHNITADYFVKWLKLYEFFTGFIKRNSIILFMEEKKTKTKIYLWSIIKNFYQIPKISVSCHALIIYKGLKFDKIT